MELISNSIDASSYDLKKENYKTKFSTFECSKGNFLTARAFFRHCLHVFENAIRGRWVGKHIFPLHIFQLTLNMLRTL